MASPIFFKTLPPLPELDAVEVADAVTRADNDISVRPPSHAARCGRDRPKPFVDAGVVC